MTVYVIEDDPGLNDALTVVIGYFGHKVISCRDAQILLDGSPPLANDIVVIDLDLPGISGGEAIRCLQRLEHPPRIIPISGKSNDFIQHQLQGTGMQAMRKPLSYDGLAAVLK